MTEIKINRLPVPAWSWLGMNESILADEEAGRFKGAEQKRPVRIFPAQREGSGRSLRFVCEDQESKAQEADLAAEAGSRLTVWMEISSPKDAEGMFQLSTHIKAEKNAKIRLVQVQLLGAKYSFVNDIKAECEEGAEVELLQLFLGGAKTWTGFEGNLRGAGSSVSADIGYWCRDTQRLDMNYVVLHKERNTKSRIRTRGVLDGQAFKLFRGTIDFRRGASGSEGEETEEVLMLGDEAVNQTIPLILCEEEDVQGNHGATIGEPDEEVLFYLACRGIGKDEAAKLLARSKIDGLTSKLGSRVLEERVQEYMEEAIENV